MNPALDLVSLTRDPVIEFAAMILFICLIVLFLALGGFIVTTIEARLARGVPPTKTGPTPGVPRLAGTEPGSPVVPKIRVRIRRLPPAPEPIDAMVIRHLRGRG